MEIWVRSQDKKTLLKCDTLTITIDSEDGKTIRGYKIVGYEDLGTYKTKKRALEVLDEIDEFIDLFQRNGFGNVLSNDGVHPKHTIYEMPKE